MGAIKMNVRELIEVLQTYDPDAKVISSGPDSGGYDATVGELNIIRVYENKVLLAYSEYVETVNGW